LVLNNVEKEGETRSIYYYYGQSDVPAYIPTCACSVVHALREKQNSPSVKNRGLGKPPFPSHYRILWFCRERDALGTGPIPLGTACTEREYSAERSRHRWAGKDLFAESHVRCSRYTCAERGVLLSAEEIFIKQKKEFQGSGPTGRLPWPHHRRSPHHQNRRHHLRRRTPPPPPNTTAAAPHHHHCHHPPPRPARRPAVGARA
jgi:hypothetical protein